MAVLLTYKSTIVPPNLPLLPRRHHPLHLLPLSVALAFVAGEAEARDFWEMDHGPVQMNAAAGEEMRSPVLTCAGKGALVCPRPRRLGPVQPRPPRCGPNFRPDSFDSKAGSELLELILSRGGQLSVESPPPFLCGSPPSRAPNPLTRDARFGQEKPPPALPGSPTAAARKGCGPLKFGPKPAAVRIEGFDCLSGDRRSRGIAAMA